MSTKQSTPPRIWMSSANPKTGEIVRVRAQISHTMETGLRLDENGKNRPRDIVTHFEAFLDDVPLFSCQMGPAVARNPYTEFTFLARKNGNLNLKWRGDNGFVLEASRAVAVQ